MTRTRKKTLFTLYAALIGVLLLYVLFPSDAVRKALVDRIQRDVPDLRVSIGDLKLAFPPALSMENVTFSKKETVLFFTDRLTMQPAWLSLVTSSKTVKFQAIAYRGKMSGVISSTRHTETGSLSISGNFSELHLDQIPVLQEKLDMGISGSASGQIHFDDITALQALGGGKVFIKDCTVIPSAPILEMDSLSFKKIDLVFTVEGNNLELQQGDFQGTELSGTLSGSILFESPTDRSVLDLDIIVTPQRLFLSKLGDTISAGSLSSVLLEQDKFNFRVTGSLGTPRVAFGAAR